MSIIMLVTLVILFAVILAARRRAARGSRTSTARSVTDQSEGDER